MESPNHVQFLIILFQKLVIIMRINKLSALTNSHNQNFLILCNNDISNIYYVVII